MDRNFQDLFNNYLSNSISPGEMDQLLRMLRDRKHLDSLERMVLAELEREQPEEAGDDAIRSSILGQLELRMAEYDQGQETGVIPMRSSGGRSWRFLAAASVLVMLAGGSFFFFRHTTPEKKLAAEAPSHKKIKPGSNKAILTLADGSEIELDASQKGDIAVQGGVKVIKLDNGSLAYDGHDNAGKVMYNTIATPRGGQYEIILPDGTHAWLNSASSLRFPASFPGAKREVTLTGQGYFEVAKKKDQPFVVHTGATEVEVLGTSFDIMAYADEPECNTTLVDGSVIVAHQGARQLLKPGEQAHLDHSTASIDVRKADVEEVIAWKNGKFQFGKSNIRTIMRQIARWYDVEVEYKGDLSAVRLSGILSRKGEVAELLDALEETGDVRFVTESNRIVVMPAGK